MVQSAVVQSKKVTPVLVHKDNEDDVLIANERRALPAVIHKGSLDAADLSTEEFAIVRRFYWSAEELNEFTSTDAEAGALFLCCVPPFIPKSLADEAETQVVATLLDTHYVVAGNGYRLKSTYLDECDQISLMNGLLPRKNHLNDFDRFLVSSVLDRLEGLDRPCKLNVSMVMDTQNYFFYRKHHEHVPGMMLLEVARQAMYAFFYRFSPYKRDQVSLSISRLDVSFLSFVDANYPVRLVVQEAGSGITKSDVHFVATLYQRNQPVAEVTLLAHLIAMKLFRRLRIVKPLDSSRFLPTKNISRNIIFQNSSGVALEGRLQDISADGLCSTFAPETELKVDEVFRCVLFVEGEGMITLEVRVVWFHEFQQRLRSGFAIQRITPDMKRKLLETIKNFTVLNTRREVV